MNEQMKMISKEEALRAVNELGKNTVGHLSHGKRRALEAKIRAFIEQDQWLPIESAPKDGTKILGYDEDGDIHVCWCYDCDRGFVREGDDYDFAFDPIHWKPLPEPPEGKE